MLGALFASFILASAAPVSADDVAVPLLVQADLLTKAAVYDRNFPDRAVGLVRVLIIARPGDILSDRIAKQMAAALHERTTIGGLPHEDVVVMMPDADRIEAIVRERHPGIVYVAPGYTDADVHVIAAKLSGADVLTVAAVPSYVPAGIVLGFDVSEGHPRLLLNLGQARLQHVQFAARLIRLMRTFQ